MEIKNIENGDNGNIIAEIEGKEAGILEYTWLDDNQLRIDHTEEYDEFQGMNVGKKMILEVVDLARKLDGKIIPECSFAKQIFDRTKAFQDVLA